MMKKIISVVLVISLIVCISCVPINAIEAISQIQYYSEYSFINQLYNANDIELSKMGYSKMQANLIIKAYYNEIERRSNMSDEELISLGYTSKDINILSKYADGAKLSPAELNAISGTCTGSITATTCNTSKAKFRYSWTWDKCPLITLADSAAVRWFAYDDNGYVIDVTRTDLSSEIYYYGGNVNGTSNDSLSFIESGDEEYGLDFNTVNIQFDMLMDKTVGYNLYLDAYAKRGIIDITVEVPSSVNNDINYVKVAGVYGHTIMGIGAPSVTASGSGASPTDLVIDFVLSTEVDKVGSRKAQISLGPIVNYIN